MKINKAVIPILVLILVAGSYLLQPLFFFPTNEIAFGATGDSTVEFIVDGLKCRGTGGFFTGMFEDTPGIESITTYAVENKAVFVYDSKLIDPDRIQVIFEREFRMQDDTFESIFKEVDRLEK